MRPRLAGRAQAFTLVELLVVIGIIAFLISVLLPALNKAREQSYKTKCLANLRTIGQALSIYAAENKDCVPIGTLISKASDGVAKSPQDSSLEFWFSYWGYWSNANGSKPTGLGKLAGIRVMKSSPMAFYCPKEDRIGLLYDQPAENPWAYKNDPPSASRHSYINYWVRPCAAFPADNTDDRPYLIEGYYNNVVTSLPRGWPKFSKLKNKAIVSDIARGPVDIRTRHKDGINVYYANGSGKFVRLTDFNKAQGVGTPGVLFPVPTPGSPGPKWTAKVWTGDIGGTTAGQGLPTAASGTDASYAHNTLYLNDTSVFPGGAGLWNWLDKAP